MGLRGKRTILTVASPEAFTAMGKGASRPVDSLTKRKIWCGRLALDPSFVFRESWRVSRWPKVTASSIRFFGERSYLRLTQFQFGQRNRFLYDWLKLRVRQREHTPAKRHPSRGQRKGRRRRRSRTWRRWRRSPGAGRRRRLTSAFRAGVTSCVGYERGRAAARCCSERKEGGSGLAAIRIGRRC